MQILISWHSESLFPFFYIIICMCYILFLVNEVDYFEPNRTLMLWCEHFVVPLLLPSSCPVYRSATEYNS